MNSSKTLAVLKIANFMVKISVPERIAAGTAGPCCSAACSSRWRGGAGWGAGAGPPYPPRSRPGPWGPLGCPGRNLQQERKIDQVNEQK